MAKGITISAPGKLMLLGEHAVVYGRPCIVTAVNQRMKATVELIEDPIFHLNAPDVQVLDYQKPMDQLGNGDIPKGAKFVEIAVKNFFDFYSNSPSRHPEQSEGSSMVVEDSSHRQSRVSTIKSGLIPMNEIHRGSSMENTIGIAQNDRFGISITTSSELSSLFGFGSSSASTVCVIKALSELTGANLDNKAIFDLAYKTILDIQGKGSGFDIAADVYGGTLYFIKGGQTIEPLKIDSLPLIVGYSGMKADTVTLMNQVLEKAKKEPAIVESIYDNIGKLMEQAKEAVLNKDWPKLGELMNKNQRLLKELGVSIKKLDDMILAARNAGAYGAKLSGAGGGDCMIALAPEDKVEAVKDAITSVGGQVINVKANVEGVRIEN